MAPRKRKQCETCPWKVGSDPHEIPNEYSVEKHLALRDTIAIPGDVSDIANPELRVMACHYTDRGNEFACVGWLHNQLGDGNNIKLRLVVRYRPELRFYELDGEQHPTFEDTLPPEARGRHGS